MTRKRAPEPDQDETPVPDIVVQWLEANGIERECFHWEAGDYPEDWEKVSDRFFCESKYNNERAIVFRHVPTGRYFQTFYSSLPHGITDYGMCPDDQYVIEEVFPVEVTKTVYLTQQEIDNRGRAKRNPA
jgi:hypothetical protein